MSTTNARVLARRPTVETSTAQFAEDVGYYLSQSPRQLPSRYLYDALGSALFDAICQLPWYGLTRAETALLTQHAAEVLAALSSAHPDRRTGLGQRREAGDAADRRPPSAVHSICIWWTSRSWRSTPRRAR